MYFKRLDMHGFKSFAEPVSIEFNHGITCIVGPNGSGKSNISDALRWVLGEQSPKTLRGGKMEDVIFAGTASRKSRGMAEVVLVIDNSTGILPIDYNEVAITRRMFRSGESEYFINGNQCRLKDIRELIMDTGIGVDGYSLIGQGKIADIVSSKTESRREIFEEAAGIVKYRSKKAEAERKLESANLNLERVNDIVGEIESRIDGLREDSERAKEYLELRDTYKDLEVNITLKNIENLELKNEYLKDDISELKYEIDSMKEEKIALDSELEEHRKRNDILEELNNDARNKLLVSTEEINAIVNDGKIKEERLASMAREEDRIENEIREFVSKKENEEIGLKEEQSKLGEIQQRGEFLQNQLNDKIGIYSELISKQTKLSEEIDRNKNALFSMQNSITAKTGEKNSLKNLKETLDRRKDVLMAEKNGANTENSQIISEQKAVLEERETYRQEVQALENKLTEYRNLYEAALSEERITTKEREEIRLSMGQMAARKKTIEEMENNYEGYNYAVKFVMKNNFEGVYGVVGDLIEVPAGYEIAIETALGASLQNIVCQKDSHAQTIIKALKTNKAGRLTLLPIESMRVTGERKEPQFAGSDGFKGMGTECVEFDPKFARVIEYLLGRVVIVDNLENALKISKNAAGGLRFVTLEGEVINSGGAITGGSYKNKTANLLERKSEIALLEEQLSVAENRKNKAEEILAKVKVKIAETLEQIKNTEKSHREAELNLISAENRLSAFENSIKSLADREGKRQAELDGIKEEQASAETMTQKLEQEIEQIENDRKSVEEKIEIDNLSLEKFRETIEEASEAITRARIDVTSWENEKNNLESGIMRMSQSVSILAAEIEKRKEQLKKIFSDREILLNTGQNRESIEEKEKEKAKLEAYIQEIAEEKSKINKEISEKSATRNSIEEKTSACQSQKYELEIKGAKYEAQLEGYKNKLWDEFEVSYLKAIEFKKHDFNMNEAIKKSREFKSKIKALGDVNIGAIKEFETVSERYEFLTKQKNDILEGMNSLKQIIDEMDRTIKMRFKESFDLIVANFESVFKELFGGGNAMLTLEDETKPLESGIEIVAQPPGKKLQNINLMSGGEKTMTAIALMFAVLKAKPTPFCILDEVEAALDDANIERFAGYLRNYDDIQFALVTHQKATMEHADVLYGVTMPERGISKVLSLKLGDRIEGVE